MKNDKKAIFLRPTARLYGRVDAAVSEIVRVYEQLDFRQLGVHSKLWYYSGAGRPDYVNGDLYTRLERIEGCGLEITFGRPQGLTPCHKYNDTAGTSVIDIGRSSSCFNTSTVLCLRENPQHMVLNIHGYDFRVPNPSGNNWDTENPIFPVFLEAGDHYVITSEVLHAFANWLNRNAFRHLEDIEITVHKESQTPKASLAEAAQAELTKVLAPPPKPQEPVFAEPELTDEEKWRIAAGWIRHTPSTWSFPMPAQSKEEAVPFDGGLEK